MSRRKKENEQALRTGSAIIPKEDLKDASKGEKLRYQVFRMVSVGVVDEPVNQAYDVISTIALIVNLVVMILNTFDNLSDRYGDLFTVLEHMTVFFFAVDYMLRVYTAKYLYPDSTPVRAIVKYVFSFAGIVDVLSFIPFYLPVFFPSGASVFRFFRVARIMRLFRINAYYDSLNVITEVISSKKQQLLSSVFIILVLMIASSLCMYSVENAAQPDVFKNAFSGIWWSASTLLTVGYGDIYPVTTMGKVLGIVISFLGVGMVAIPTGIISAGFVEQYSRLKRIGENSSEEDIRFIHLLMIYLASLPETDFDDNAQLRAIKDIKSAALFRNAEIRKRAEKTLDDIRSFVLQSFPEYSSVIDFQLEKTKPGNSYAEIISERFSGAYMEKGLKLAKEYQRSVGYV